MKKLPLDFRYKDLSPEKIKTDVDAYREIFKEWIKYNNSDLSSHESIDADKVFVDLNSLIDIFKRIDKRIDYYWYFHGIEMSESKEIALIIFWTVKFKPFFYNLESCNRNSTINERFAAFLLKIFIYKNTDSKVLEEFFEKAESNITYYFMNRDISKESLMFYITSILGVDDII